MDKQTIEALFEKIDKLTAIVLDMKKQQEQSHALPDEPAPVSLAPDAPAPVSPAIDPDGECDIADFPLCEGCNINAAGQFAHMGYGGCLNSDIQDNGL
tara:strand:+ start:397 stop:690 length:294 start_codon:yes stop_codon:yes gene_type:complete